jgi:phosphoglycerate dehydrogenase-like enzyme
MGSKPSALVLLRPELYRTLFSAQADAGLRALADVTYNDQEQDWPPAELAQRIGGHQIAITGWGSPRFTDEVLQAAGALRLVAHSAGSIRHLLPPAVFARGIAVTHAAAAIAPAVADMSLLMTMLMLRLPHTMDVSLKQGLTWKEAQGAFMGREVTGQRVGVIGAGYTGRCFMRLLLGVGAEVWVYDPYLTAERALELSVRKVALDDLLSGCPVVSLQAPSTAETHHLLGARELGLLQDGAILVNTARSWLVDQDALLAELRAGRIWAALDVFDEEPLPQGHPLRQLDHVFLTPHIAGASQQARLRQGQFMVDEIERFLTGEPLRYRVTLEMLETMA